MSSAGFEVSQPTLHAEHMHYHSNLAASMARQHKRVKFIYYFVYSCSQELTILFLFFFFLRMLFLNNIND